MEGKKSNQYTFGPEEKEILEILSTFENQFEEIQKDEKNELQSVKYYESFAIKGMKNAEISGVFMTKEQDAEGNISYHLYYESPSNEILSIDSEGKIKIDPRWKEAIGEIDIEKTMEINEQEPERLKGISEKAEPKKMKKALEKDEKEESEEEKPEEQIQEDIGGEEDLGISYYREIEDKNFGEQMNMNLSGYEEVGLAYSETKDAFILVGKRNGQFQQVEGFEPAQPTFKTVMSIDENGEKVKKEVPHALMQTKNEEKELSITIDQYGYIETGTIDRLPCDERVKRQVREQGEGEEGRTNIELNRVIEEEGREGIHNYIERNEESNENMKVGQTRKENVAKEIANSGTEINRDDYIPNTKMTWGELMDKTGESLSKLIDRYDREISKEGAEPEEVIETIENDYENVGHEHERRPN